VDVASQVGAQVTRAGLRAAAILAILLSWSSSTQAAERYAVIISGVAGGEKYATQQQKWRAALAVALKTTFTFDDANVVVLDEESGGTSKATAANVRKLFDDLRRRVKGEDTLLVVFFGHGTFDGADAKFNLVGPDLSAGEWKALLDPVAARMVVVNTTESSFPFLEELSQKNRIVITATDSAAQRFATVFPEYFVQALGTDASDFDKNGRVSVWEAFEAASAGVKEYYEQRGQLSTERPLLDDDGDRNGREAEAPGEDGKLARAVYLDPEPGTISADVAIAALQRQRVVLEAQLEELKSRKDALSDDAYQAELERILVQLAKIAQQIRSRS
jgi:hypothetical protein